MSKKDLKFVGIIVAVAALIGVIMLVVKLTSKPKELGIVQHGEEVILTFDIAKDATYDFEGDYGKMTLDSYRLSAKWYNGQQCDGIKSIKND